MFKFRFQNVAPIFPPFYKITARVIVLYHICIAHILDLGDGTLMVADKRLFLLKGSKKDGNSVTV
jgi:hypothetical protein